MPAVSRQGDSLTTGHICVATTSLTTPGQSTVFANGILVARITDSTVSHLFPPNVPPCGSHTSTVKQGSETVFVAGRKFICGRRKIMSTIRYKWINSPLLAHNHRSILVISHSLVITDNP